jgi:tetratricopeptide (TPR) repeat protein
MRPNTRLILIAACLLDLCLLSACASKSTRNVVTKTPDNEPTLKSLAGRTVIVKKDQGVVTSEAQAIKAYRSFLDTAPKAPKISNAPLRAEAMRRIGDLEMDSADNKSEGPQTGNTPDNGPDYRIAIMRYQEFLKTYPKDPANDHVLYQLSRAQEQNGDLESALKTLDHLVKGYPNTSYSDEAQFRRGELLFTTRDYVLAENAYSTVLRSGTTGRYHDRALYMRGWSQFKQGKLDDSVQSFFGVLDVKLAGHEGDAGLETIASLSRADRELVEDTFRVTSISLANLQGAESIPAYINSPQREAYEFRVYQQLGELYLKQERVKDAADTFALFARRKPLDAQAPILQARVIDIYQSNGFATLALEAKKEYVVRYGSKSEFRRANSAGWMKAQSLVQIHLAELARHYHASAQKTKNAADYQEAIRWYREAIDSFPSDPQTAQHNFLLAELLFENQQFVEASIEYEKTAYDYPAHGKSADAGYSALLSYARQQKKADAPDLASLQKASVASAIRFAETFSADPRAAAVLANAAEKLYALKDPEQAAKLAQKLLELQPAAADEQRRIAWTILAYTAFERGAFAESELAFTEVLKLTAANVASRNELVERLAATIYKQGEQARNAGQLSEAVRHFERIATLASLSTLAPASPIRATAQYDAAATLMSLKDWSAASRTLEDFRSRYPNNALQTEVSNKLAVAYLENAQWENAAKELEHIAVNNKDAKLTSDMLWQAAELYEKAGSRVAAKKTYERFLTLQTQNLVPAIEARFRLANIAKEDGNGAREFALMKEIFHADQNGGAARTERTRYLGAAGALAIAEPVAEAYRKVALIEPLQKNLKLKKTKMEDALKAYAVATDYGVADVSTAATFRIASIYRDFGKALMASERPKKLNKIEREQYNVLLEEQAFPFEEKAIEVHTINAQRSANGIYDKWVKNSFDALRELQPVRYGKTERTEAFTASAQPSIQQAAEQNQLGVTLRQSGKFEQAREAYEQAIKLDANYAPPLLNLGILHDMYLADGKQALELYVRYLALKPAGDPEVNKWIAELKNRKPNPASAPPKEKS